MVKYKDKSHTFLSFFYFINKNKNFKVMGAEGSRIKSSPPFLPSEVVATKHGKVRGKRFTFENGFVDAFFEDKSMCISS